MKPLLIAAIAALLIFTPFQPVEAGSRYKAQAICTEEVCRRCFTKNNGMGKNCTATYSQVVYRTTYRESCGKTYTKTWTKTDRIK